MSCVYICIYDNARNEEGYLHLANKPKKGSRRLAYSLLFRRRRVFASVTVVIHDESVALEVVETTLLKEVLGFLEEEDSVPLRNHLQDVRQGSLDFKGVEPKVTKTHHVEGCFHFHNGNT